MLQLSFVFCIDSNVANNCPVALLNQTDFADIAAFFGNGGEKTTERAKLLVVTHTNGAHQLIRIYLLSEWLCHRVKSRRIELPINSLMMELSGIRSLSRGRNHSRKANKRLASTYSVLPYGTWRNSGSTRGFKTDTS